MFASWKGVLTNSPISYFSHTLQVIFQILNKKIIWWSQLKVTMSSKRLPSFVFRIHSCPLSLVPWSWGIKYFPEKNGWSFCEGGWLKSWNSPVPRGPSSDIIVQDRGCSSLAFLPLSCFFTGSSSSTGGSRKRQESRHHAELRMYVWEWECPCNWLFKLCNYISDRECWK